MRCLPRRGETAQADGGAAEAPVDMATACQSVVFDAMFQMESEARKVGM